MDVYPCSDVPSHATYELCKFAWLFESSRVDRQRASCDLSICIQSFRLCIAHVRRQRSAVCGPATFFTYTAQPMPHRPLMQQPTCAQP